MVTQVALVPAQSAGLVHGSPVLAPGEPHLPALHASPWLHMLLAQQFCPLAPHIGGATHMLLVQVLPSVQAPAQHALPTVPHAMPMVQTFIWQVVPAAVQVLFAQHAWPAPPQ